MYRRRAEEPMEMIHAEKLIYEYDKRDEDGNVVGTNRMAKCCNPVFGDDVFGFVTRTEGIKIHRMSCPNAARLLEMFLLKVRFYMQ